LRFPTWRLDKLPQETPLGALHEDDRHGDSYDQDADDHQVGPWFIDPVRAQFEGLVDVAREDRDDAREDDHETPWPTPRLVISSAQPHQKEECVRR